MRRAEVADHLLGLQHTRRLPRTSVLAGVYRPKVIARRERRGTVLRVNPVDLLETLRIDTQNFRWASIGTDHGIANPQFTDGPKAIGGQYFSEHWLCSS